MLRSTITAAALLALASTAAAASGSGSSSGNQNPQRSASDPQTSQQPYSTRSQSSQSQPADPGTARLVAADKLVGRDVTTREGERVGTLKFVTLNLEDGRVSHLIIDTSDSDMSGASGTTSGTTTSGTATRGGSSSGSTTSGGNTSPGTSSSSGDEQGDLMIVPWDVAQVDADSRELVLSATTQQIASAPRLKDDQLNRLTEPTMAAYVIDYWAPASELAAMEGRNDQSQSEQQRSSFGDMQRDRRQRQQPERSSSDASGAPQAAGTDSQVQRSTLSGAPLTAIDGESDQSRSGTSRDSATGERDMEAERSTAITSAEERARTQARAAQQAGEQSSGEQSGSQSVLVGQEVVATVTPPMFQLGQDLQGATVRDRNGEELGTIRRIMIDVDEGHAAFAVLQGGKHGESAVPLQTLKWTEENATVLEADASALQPVEELVDDPSQVDRQALAQLYQRFGAETYWEQSSGSSSGTDPRSHSQTRE